jgi:excisionase family DNA binding protein
MESISPQLGYFDLKALAAYSCCSVRWLRDRLVDQEHPLPHHRVGGKVLVKREDFDRWIARYRQDRPADELADVVNGVLAQMACQ